MVNETVDISTHILDFNFDNSSRLAQSQLQRSCSGNFAVDQQQQQHHLQQSAKNPPQKDLLTVSLNSHLLPPSSAENLSWQFFEQVSSLDNQLRSDESSAVTRANGSHLMTTNNSLATHDACAVTAVDGQQRQQQTELIARKSNGFANVANTTVDHLSQQSPDVIQLQQQQQQQQQQHQAIFKFTSPTSTFKRKKQQQQQQQQLNQQHQISSNNNNNYNNNQQQRNISATTTIRNQLQAPYDHHQSSAISPSNSNHCYDATTTKTIATKQQQQKQKQPEQRNEPPPPPPPTMISSGAGVIIHSNTAVGGVIGTASATGATPKTRTLPAISTTPMKAYAEGVDLVGNTKEAAVGARGRHHRSQKMGGSGSVKSSFVDDIELHLGLIGWRKKCLYALLALLMLLIITNLVLTLWILKVMEFSTEGMGPLKIVPGGVQLTGQAIIMDMLRASTIRSRHGQPISIESSRNFSINTRDTNGMLENHLFLGHDKLECLATGFRINNTDGKNIFSVNRNEVTIGAHALRIDGEGGAIFRESIQTPHVRAEPGRELRLESPTRQLEMTAAKDINLVSRAGSIEISALDDVKLSALDGSLRLESSTILMPNLRTAQPPIQGAPHSRDHLHRVFQLCACANGKLFLAAPNSICAGDDTCR